MMGMAGGGFVMVSREVQVRPQMAADGRSAQIELHFMGAGGGLLQVIDLRAISPNRTHITVHRLNNTRTWTNAARAVERWFYGESACFAAGDD